MSTFQHTETFRCDATRFSWRRCPGEHLFLTFCGLQKEKLHASAYLSKMGAAKLSGQHTSNLAAKATYNFQVCSCLSMLKIEWIINACSSQHLSVHVSGKGNNKTFYILQVTSYFSDPGARNLILSKLGNLCFSLNGILAVINPLLRCVLPEEGMCNQQD